MFHYSNRNPNQTDFITNIANIRSNHLMENMISSTYHPTDDIIITNINKEINDVLDKIADDPEFNNTDSITLAKMGKKNKQLCYLIRQLKQYNQQINMKQTFLNDPKKRFGILGKGAGASVYIIKNKNEFDINKITNQINQVFEYLKEEPKILFSLIGKKYKDLRIYAKNNRIKIKDIFLNDKEKRFVLSESNSLGDIGITLSKEFREKYNIKKNDNKQILKGPSGNTTEEKDDIEKKVEYNSITNVDGIVVNDYIKEEYENYLKEIIEEIDCIKTFIEWKEERNKELELFISKINENPYIVEKKNNDKNIYLIKDLKTNEKSYILEKKNNDKDIYLIKDLLLFKNVIAFFEEEIDRNKKEISEKKNLKKISEKKVEELHNLFINFHQLN